MKIHLISDIHLEFGDLTLPGGEVLILAGDACESRTLNNYKYDPHGILTKNSRGERLDRAARFFWEECAKYQHVIYVMGNHEHYHGKTWKTWNEINQEIPNNVHLLEQEKFQLDGVVFLGSTLWTDLNRGDPLCAHTLSSMMNDYRLITHSSNGTYGRLRPRDTADIHQQTLDWMQKELASHSSDKVVVVTHHAPSYQSISEKYRDDKHMNGGYASDLSEFILDHPQIKIWCHGHTHTRFDYQVGDVRVLCNPRGYQGYEEIAEDFTPLEFEI